MRSVCVVLGLLSVLAVADEWDAVRTFLDGYPERSKWKYSDFSMSVGTPKERVFTYTSPSNKVTMQTQVQMASSSKFPSASMILVAVQEGYLTLADHPQQFLDFWTSDPADLRSKITLGQLLSFTSGYYSTSAGSSVNCLNGWAPKMSFDDCMQDVFDQVLVTDEPGTIWDYNSYHLQIAGAMASAATNLSASAFIDRFLIKKLGLVNTTYGELNPLFAATMQTTGDDYDTFLRSYLSGDMVQAEFQQRAETDVFSDPKVKPSNQSGLMLDSLGHYGYAHWVECLFNNGTWTQKCQDLHLHSDPGLFGYYPIIDRNNDYYMQQVYQNIYGNTTNPTSLSMALRLQVKPMIDAIITGQPVPVPMPQHEAERLADQLSARFRARMGV